MFDKSREKRQRHHAAAMVELQARGAAERIIDHLNNGDEPPYCFNAQQAPEPLSVADYAGQVGQTTLTLIKGELETAIGYDHEASLQTTMERSPAPPQEVILVFD